MVEYLLGIVIGLFIGLIPLVIIIQSKNKVIANMNKRISYLESELKDCDNRLQNERADKSFSKDDTLAKALNKVIVQHQKLSVNEIDASLKTTPLTIVNRMTIKNRLLEIGWMEAGYIAEERYSSAFPKFPVVKEDEDKLDKAIEQTYNKKHRI